MFGGIEESRCRRNGWRGHTQSSNQESNKLFFLSSQGRGSTRCALSIKRQVRLGSALCCRRSRLSNSWRQSTGEICRTCIFRNGVQGESAFSKSKSKDETSIRFHGCPVAQTASATLFRSRKGRSRQD